MKNSMTDLNNHLFAQLERLSEEGMSEDQIATEAKRAEAIVSVADQIVSNAQTQLKAAALFGVSMAARSCLCFPRSPAAAPLREKRNER